MPRLAWGTEVNGVLLMSERRRERPKPPSFSLPFSSKSTLLGLRSQYTMLLEWRYWRMAEGKRV